MNIQVLDSKRILITKNNTNYLIEKDYISSTMIINYFVYVDIGNNLDYFLNCDPEDRHFYYDCCDLLETIKFIQEND